MNSEEQREHWDLKYEQGLPSLTQPDPFFVSAYEQFADQCFPNPGTALDFSVRPRETRYMAGQQELAGQCSGPFSRGACKAQSGRS